MSDLYLPSGRVLRPPDWRKTSGDVYAVQMPIASLQALFELMSWLVAGEYERKLREFTDLSDREIEQRAIALDRLHEYLWNQGMRPAKIKASVKRHGRKVMGSILQAPDGTRL